MDPELFIFQYFKINTIFVKEKIYKLYNPLVQANLNFRSTLQTITVPKKTEKGIRTVWIDWLRVTAIFLVVIIHSTEPFYLGGEGSLILSQWDSIWVSLFDSFARSCVPLFIIASSYLQFPLYYSSKEFFMRRMKRILIPFAVWTIIYALVWGEPIENFSNLLLNFNYAAGHLWFVYMLVGIYLLMPILSPWAEKVSQKELLFYIGIFLFSSFIPFIREMNNTEGVYIEGPSGIPAFAKYPLWGESSWNTYGVFYYFSGFIGYLLLGLFLKKFYITKNRKKEILTGLSLWLIGFGISFGGFLYLVDRTSEGIFPVEGNINLGVLWETPWSYDSFGVVLMVIGFLLIFRQISLSGNWYNKLIHPLAKSSYGTYLCHMLVLIYVSHHIRELFGLADSGIIGIFTTPIEILLSAIITFFLASGASYFVGKLPRIGKYIMG